MAILRLLYLCMLLLSAGLTAHAKDGAKPAPLEIVRITPAGEDAPAARQIVIEFNRPVAAPGPLAEGAETGITITPSAGCTWRWLNASALSCDLSEKDALTPATVYALTINPAIKTEDGGTLTKPQTHSFTTERPRLQDASIMTWASPVKPVLRAVFSQPVTKSSVESHIYLRSEKDSSRIPVAAEPDPNDKDPAPVKGKDEARTVWLLLPAADLPENAKVTLEQEAGLISLYGDAPGRQASNIKGFYTFPAFALRGVYCYDKKSQEVLITPGSPQTDENLCNPMMPAGLSFTAPVLRSQVRDNLGLSPTLVLPQSEIQNPWGDQNADWSRLSDQRESQTSDYRIAFPIGLKAAQSYNLAFKATEKTTFGKMLELLGKHYKSDGTLRDEFGRTLPDSALSFATGHRNPNFELTYQDAVLETGNDSDVPLYVNNLKKFDFRYNALTHDRSYSKSTDNKELPVATDKQFAVSSGVRSMLGGKSGAVYATLRTTPEVNKWDGAHRLFAQVTPYQMYFKLGHFQSLLWVTRLSDGKPAANAQIRVYRGTLAKLQEKGDTLATVKTDENGLAILPGRDTLDPTLTLDRAWRDTDDRLFVRVDGDDGMALLPVGYAYAVSMWNMADGLYAQDNEKYGHMKAWGMTAQGIYRAGDTMQYKIYVRDQDNRKFIAPPSGKYSLEISDPAGKVVEKRDGLLPDDFGTLSGEYAIPESAAIGWYGFKLIAALSVNGKETTRDFYPLSVLVSDFTPAPFRVTTELNGDKFMAGDTLDISAAAKLHSGGGYGGASVRTNITLSPRNLKPESPALAGYIFDSFTGTVDLAQILDKSAKLDDSGEWKTSLTLPEKNIAYGQISVESAVRDDRGKSIAARTTASYAGVDRLVGIKSTRWVYDSGKPAALDIAVVSPDGKIAEGIDITATAEREVVSTAKVKSAGNAYVGDTTVEWEKAGECRLKSASEGLPCAFTPKSAGTYRLTATVKDTKGRTHTTQREFYVSGADYVQWNEDKEYALPVLPEKPDYKAGETARYLVKNPYPGATALVTVERYGVIDSFTTILDGSAPVIEIPVKDDYAPGFYVSVTVFSPRAETPPPGVGQIDMGKPAFRAGYAKTLVSDPVKQISVTAKPLHDTYRPRDTVNVTFDVATHGTNEPVQMAVAVLDESVFDLIKNGRTAFDPYEGFYALDPIDVSNYSLLTRLMGRQKFEKKGANPGGDGGVDAGMRTLFKYVGYWNPSVPVNQDGKATISFEAPDNLTGWRVLALAATPTDRLGLGEATFKVNRMTEIRPAMPNNVREGDTFGANFTVMNRSDEHRTIKVIITAEGDVDDKKPLRTETTLDLDPYKRASVSLPVDASILPLTRDTGRGQIRFNVTAGDETDSDGIEHTLPVLKSRSPVTIASYGAIDSDSAEEKIAVPSDIYPDSTDISLIFSPTLLTGLDGAFRYMRDYPYTCWEQKITTAVLAAQYNGLKPFLAQTTMWENAAELPDMTLRNAASYQAPNGGMAFFTARDEYVDPYLSAYTALAFGWLKESGHTPPPQVESSLHKYLLNFLRNNAAPDYYSKEMTASVRAIILAALKDKDGVTADDIIRFRADIPAMDVFGLTHYIKAAKSFPKTRAAYTEAQDNLLARGILSAGKFSLNDKTSGGFDRILSTTLRSNCAALGALGDTLPESKASGLVRYITQSRGSRDHWENTQENVFCMNALLSYAKRYESISPKLRVTASLDTAPLGEISFTKRTDAAQTITRALGEKDTGTQKTLRLEKEGTGRAYYESRLRYAPKDLSKPRNDGIDIGREYSVLKDGVWTAINGTVNLKRGDTVRVDIYVSLPTARNFIVVNDPLPGALETINQDLATASSSEDATRRDKVAGSRYAGKDGWSGFSDGRWGFYHRELRHDSARFYTDWIEPGNYRLTYTAQAVAEGDFTAPPVRAEEMYNPDISGAGVTDQIHVDAAP